MREVLTLATIFLVPGLSIQSLVASKMNISVWQSQFNNAESHFDPGRMDRRAWCMRHLLQREYDFSITDCTAAIRSDPDDSEPYSNRGSAHLLLNNWDNAILDFSEAIRKDPGDSNHHYNRALALDRKGEYLLAIQDYDKAIEINPRFGAAYYNRAQCMTAIGERDKAVSDYRHALELVPELSDIIAELLRRIGAQP